MNGDTFMSDLAKLYNSVLNGSENYTELQNFIDAAVIEDKLPLNLTDKSRKLVFDLQTELELIAENQAANNGTRFMLTNENILDKLRVFKDSFE